MGDHVAGNGENGTSNGINVTPAVTENFRKGVAISTWQNSGDDDSNWTRYTYKKWPLSWFGISTTRGPKKIGKSCDFWHRFREDIGLAKQTGCTAFRFSFEWARVEPTRGKYDESAIAKFHEMLDVMEELGLEPSCTLHHFTHPGWFEDLGGFEKEQNIQLFVDWSANMFRMFHKRIRMWATFNEPTCFTFLGYIAAMGPPGYICNLIGAGRTLLHVLKAHTATYRALKALPGGDVAQIGLVHHHITFAAQGQSKLHYVADTMATWLEYWWAWDIVDHWMMTGEFSWKLPVIGEWFRYKDPLGKPPCDWWGINYYSRCVLSWYLQPCNMPKEVMTDMYYPIYPMGLYDAIERSSKYKIPMYITETGIADVRDDRRTLFIDSYFKEVLRALANGFDVRGFYYWTLMDNFEWATGFTMKFGLYTWDPDGSPNNRKLKEGAKALVRFYKTLPDDLPSLKRVCQAEQKVTGNDYGIAQHLKDAGLPVAGPDRQFSVDGHHLQGVAALG